MPTRAEIPQKPGARQAWIANPAKGFKMELMKKPKSAWPGLERRRHPRLDVRFEISYQHLDDFFYDYAINLSRGGIFIRSINPLAVGTGLKLRFSIPGRKEVIETSGRIVRVVKPGDPHGQDPGMGIEFQALGEKDLALINSLWGIESEKVNKKP
jgi:uncharacterized protein (TIGR02266 family)